MPNKSWASSLIEFYKEADTGPDFLLIGIRTYLAERTRHPQINVTFFGRFTVRFEWNGDFDDLAISTMDTQNTFRVRECFSHGHWILWTASFCEQKSSNSRQIVELHLRNGFDLIRTRIHNRRWHYLNFVRCILRNNRPHGQWRAKQKTQRKMSSRTYGSFSKCSTFTTNIRAKMRSCSAPTTININKNPFAWSYVTWLLSLA